MDALKIVREVLLHENDFKPAQIMIITTPGSDPVSVFDPAYGRMVSRPRNHKGDPTGEIQHYVDPSAIMEIYDHLASAGQEWEHAALLQVFTKKSIALAKKAPDLYPRMIIPFAEQLRSRLAESAAPEATEQLLREIYA